MVAVQVRKKKELESLVATARARVPSSGTSESSPAATSGASRCTERMHA